jgi:hypothetical protein
MTKLIVAFRNFANAPKSRCNERRNSLKNVLVNTTPAFPRFCRLLVKMRKRDPHVILLSVCENALKRSPHNTIYTCTMKAVTFLIKGRYSKMCIASWNVSFTVMGCRKGAYN